MPEPHDSMAPNKRSRKRDVLLATKLGIPRIRPYVSGPELEQFSLEQLKSADMLLFGRATYQGMASFWPSAQGECDSSLPA